MEKHFAEAVAYLDQWYCYSLMDDAFLFKQPIEFKIYLLDCDLRSDVTHPVDFMSLCRTFMLVMASTHTQDELPDTRSYTDVMYQLRCSYDVGTMFESRTVKPWHYFARWFGQECTHYFSYLLGADLLVCEGDEGVDDEPDWTGEFLEAAREFYLALVARTAELLSLPTYNTLLWGALDESKADAIDKLGEAGILDNLLIDETSKLWW